MGGPQYRICPPRFTHHTLAVQVQQIKQYKGHVPTGTLALSEYRLDTLVAVTRARLTVEDSGLEWPRNLSEPRHARVLQKIQTAATETPHRATTVNMELGSLAIELGFGDVAALRQPGHVGESFAQHGRDETSHSHSIVPVRRLRGRPTSHYGNTRVESSNRPDHT